MSVASACQIPVEEEEEDEDDAIPWAGHDELLRAYPNRQVTKRHCFTLYDKMAFVRQIQCNIEGGNLSIQAACKAFNLHHKHLITWKIEIVLMKERRNKNAKSLREGLASVLYPIEEQLLHYIFKWRECGIAVSSRLVIIKAAALCRELRDRVPTYATIHQFIARHGLVHHMGTRISQQHPRELEVIATVFMESSNGIWDKQRPRLHHQYGPVSYPIYFRYTENFGSGLCSYSLYLEINMWH